MPPEDYINEDLFCVFTAAWQDINLTSEAGVEYLDQASSAPAGLAALRCRRCAPGCEECKSPAPCLAEYNWPFR